MNITAHIGRLVADPELRPLQSTNLCLFTIAVKTGKDKTAFIQCKAWGGTGEAIFNHFKKGSLIGIKGRLDQDRWEDKEGRKQEKIVIIAEEFTFCGKKENSEPDGNVRIEEDDTMTF